MTVRDNLRRAMERDGKALVFAMFGDIDPQKVLGTGETAQELSESFDRYLAWQDQMERVPGAGNVISIEDHRSRSYADRHGI